MSDYSFTIEGQYEAKKASCEKRALDFNFTLEEFRIFWHLRGKVDCFYTDKPMRLTKDKGVPEDYATIDRINSDLPYSPANCIWCQNHVNQLKGSHIENDQNLPKNNAKVAGIVARIKKVLNNPKTLERKLKDYKDAYKQVEEHETTLAEENLKAMKEKKEQAKWETEQLFAGHYIELAKEFEKVGATMKITLGELKKSLFRCNKDQITGEEFDSLLNKKLWVIDKTKPVVLSNVKIVNLNTRNALDLLTMQCDVGKLALNIHKVAQNTKEK